MKVVESKLTGGRDDAHKTDRIVLVEGPHNVNEKGHFKADWTRARTAVLGRNTGLSGLQGRQKGNRTDGKRGDPIMSLQQGGFEWAGG